MRARWILLLMTTALSLPSDSIATEVSCATDYNEDLKKTIYWCNRGDAFYYGVRPIPEVPPGPVDSTGRPGSGASNGDGASSGENDGNETGLGGGDGPLAGARAAREQMIVELLLPDRDVLLNRGSVSYGGMITAGKNLATEWAGDGYKVPAARDGNLQADDCLDSPAEFAYGLSDRIAVDPCVFASSSPPVISSRAFLRAAQNQGAQIGSIVWSVGPNLMRVSNELRKFEATLHNQRLALVLSNTDDMANRLLQKIESVPVSSAMQPSSFRGHNENASMAHLADLHLQLAASDVLRYARTAGLTRGYYPSLDAARDGVPLERAFSTTYAQLRLNEWRLRSAKPKTNQQFAAQHVGLDAVESGYRSLVAGKSDEAAAFSAIATAMLDIALSVAPVTGFAKDVYEFLVGKSLVTGAELSPVERGFAAVGMLTAGTASSVVALRKAGALLVRNRSGRTMAEMIVRVADSGAEEWRRAFHIGPEVFAVRTSIAEYERLRFRLQAEEGLGELMAALNSRSSNELIPGSRLIIEGNELADTDLIKQLVADGSKQSDWGKYSIERAYDRSVAELHYYWNSRTRALHSDVKYKVLSRDAISNTPSLSLDLEL